jgi:hypothetical protein
MKTQRSQPQFQSYLTPSLDTKHWLLQKYFIHRKKPKFKPKFITCSIKAQYQTLILPKMASTQENPANSTANEPANPADPITTPEAAPKEKLSFAERHKAPTTKDVETNKWVFGTQQVVSGPADHSADHAGTDLGDGNPTPGTAAASGETGTSRVGEESGGMAQGVNGENTGAEQEGGKKMNPLKKVVEAVKHI